MQSKTIVIIDLKGLHWSQLLVSENKLNNVNLGFLASQWTRERRKQTNYLIAIFEIRYSKHLTILDFKTENTKMSFFQTSGNPLPAHLSTNIVFFPICLYQKQDNGFFSCQNNGEVFIFTTSSYMKINEPVLIISKRAILL